ncbi:unnamed protein product [Hydatigera taeniaeformis]|uniref:WWE domain-containing protein n=1 Tax=Hydatigena taeniaeformis TaxID=6205 RepID=A0A0R3WPP1_HYDTA|nr:unnamed protein product [Hydatigera taeniaeformis]
MLKLSCNGFFLSDLRLKIQRDINADGRIHCFGIPASQATSMDNDGGDDDDDDDVSAMVALVKHQQQQQQCPLTGSKHASTNTTSGSSSNPYGNVADASTQLTTASAPALNVSEIAPKVVQRAQGAQHAASPQIPPPPPPSPPTISESVRHEVKKPSKWRWETKMRGK